MRRTACTRLDALLFLIKARKGYVQACQAADGHQRQRQHLLALHHGHSVRHGDDRGGG